MNTPYLPRFVGRQVGERCAQLISERTGQPAAFYARHTPRDMVGDCVAWSVADASVVPAAFTQAAHEHGLAVDAEQVAEHLVIDGPPGEQVAALLGVRYSHLAAV